jgi:hypothetical protein
MAERTYTEAEIRQRVTEHKDRIVQLSRDSLVASFAARLNETGEWVSGVDTLREAILDAIGTLSEEYLMALIDTLFEEPGAQSAPS